MSAFSRRVGSKVEHAGASQVGPVRGGGGGGAVRKPTALRILPLFVVLPALGGILSGNASATLGSVVAFALLIWAGFLVHQGLIDEADYDARRVARPPAPRKTIGAAVVGASTFVLGWLGADSALPMALLYGALAALGCGMAYGLDPRGRKEVDPELARRYGIKTEDLIAALSEAESKIREIELDARALSNRELTTRLQRIAERARIVLAQVEKDPGDLRRARRFFVTYLDGTRDVVRKYRAQQADLEDTPLAESLRHVLETVERVFAEQSDVLKKNDSLDLEVQIEVLRTQLEKEGVH